MISLIISILFLLKLEESFAMVVFIIMLPVLYTYNGNIDPFILMILLLCCYYEKNQFLPPILLGFISFKPTVIFVVPYFLYITKNKCKFILFYISFLLLFNIYLIFNIDVVFEFLNYGFGDWQTSHYMDYIRPYWIYYLYYFGLKKEYNKRKIIKRFE